MNTETHFLCADCGQILPFKSEGATGYAVLPDGKRICYACSDNRERLELLDRSKPFCGYVSSDGKQITSWPGGKLMDVISSTPCTLTRQSYTHDRGSYRSIRARDIHGGEWSGRGSAGIAIKLRPVKSK